MVSSARPDAVGQLAFAQRHDLVELLAKDAERQIERHAGRHPFGERRDRVVAHARSRAPRARERVRALRLHADDGGSAAEPRSHERAAARAASSADRHEDHVDVRKIFEDLQRIRRDAVDQVRLVRGVHVAQAVRVLQGLDVLARLVEVPSMLDDRRAERSHRGVLVGVVAQGNHDRARHAFEPARERDRLAVIAGRRGNHAAALVGRQVGDEVQPAANLERAGRIVVLVLDEQAQPGLRVEERVRQ